METWKDIREDEGKVKGCGMKEIYKKKTKVSEKL